jgi:hypothetical protein
MNRCCRVFSPGARGSLFILLFLTFVFTAAGSGSATVGELGDFLPRGSKIIQVISDARFDHDDDLEYLALYSLRGRFGLILLDRGNNQRYSVIFQKNLGDGSPKTEGRAGFGDTAYTYRILQNADLDGDGILEFWTIFQPADSSSAEMTMYKFRNQHYSQMFSVRAGYDLQFIDYQGKLVIHEVNGPEQGEVAIQSKIWNPRTNVLEAIDTSYRMTQKDYLTFARSRRRPCLFSPTANTGGQIRDIEYCWGESLNSLQEIPQGEKAISSLLPENAFLLEIVLDPAFSPYVEKSYVFTYQVPDKTNSKRVLLLAAQATWDFENARYQLTPLPFQAYGLARDPEGNLYKSLYILPGNAFNHLALLGNGERLSSLKLAILNNNGLFFEEAAVFNGDFHLQFVERFNFTDFSYHYEVITADRAKNKVNVKKWRAVPEGVYDEVGRFELVKEESYQNTREYKSIYYRIEEPVWLREGYEESIFRSFNRPQINPFTSGIPEPDFSGRLVEYIFKYMTPLRIHQWVYWEDGKGNEEALLLLRTDQAFWPPAYSLGFLYRHEDGISLDTFGPSSLVIGDGNPLSGVYLGDITGDGRSELLVLSREYDFETGKNWLHLNIMEKQGRKWRRIHDRDIQYDDLRLYKTGDEIWLFGYLQGEAKVVKNAVYPFIWENGRFNYLQKTVVENFARYLETLPGEKTDLLDEEFLLFPGPPGGRILEGGTFPVLVGPEETTALFPR